MAIIEDSLTQKQEQMIQQLKSCQLSKGVDSCMKCNEIIGCRVRLEYVNAVYTKMNKGKGGGFEF